MGIKTGNQPEGNYYNKYKSKNIIVRKLMKGFFDSYYSVLEAIQPPNNVLEVGCGEGEVTNFIADLYYEAKIDAFDVSEKVVEIAKENCRSNINFYVGSAYEIRDDKYDLIICSEVLEHLEEPKIALEQIKKVGKRDVIVSVPREPIWRVLNMMRGKYILDFGNTPGHVNHWSKKQFISFLEKSGFEIVQYKSPLPWTVVHMRVLN